MFDTRKQLLKTIKEFLAQSGMSRTQFGYLAAGDPAFIRKVEEGREPRFETRLRVEQFIKSER